uniref:NADH-ubiquinone oxidoreductase chain 5 n=1 Tax=Trimma taylori TaxID=1402041 RepID=A0A455TP09_9GOBI|nr:NADH dehydrogenase subunit 5 [Trimma taylori]
MHTQKPSLLMATMLLAIIFMLVLPLLSTLSPTPKENYRYGRLVTASVKAAFLFSLFPLSLYFSCNTEAIFHSFTWMAPPNFMILISLKFDFYSAMFLPVALYVSWAILQFAQWYMYWEPNKGRFFKYLLTFLLAMIVLVTSNNMMQLFIGWEGVGIMSFMLISWWYARLDAHSAALQAVLYNRIGDIGLVFAMYMAAVFYNSWELEQIFTQCINGGPELKHITVALIVAAAGKSAQFGLHPWLPAAMEGPTPVSALLHSSTMVVAGIFLLIRMNPLMEGCKLALTLCLCLGALTSLFAATCALTQNDLKKIIAYSTSSQLGLMMVTIGLNQPQLAFLHICTHAFFKAMLFMCAGVIIHCLNGEQDIRKMGGMYQLAPLTSSCLTIGSLALTGTPFLAGFYSKDAIIEALITSNLNAWALLITLVATCFTAAYSLRIIWHVCLGHPRFPPLVPINENSPYLAHPLKRLILGSIVAGWVIASHTPFPKVPPMTMPVTSKMAALIVTLVGLYIAWSLASFASKQFKPFSKGFKFNFSNMVGFYTFIVHRLPTKTGLSFGQSGAAQAVDQTWLEKSAPKAMVDANRPLASILSSIQKGAIKTFLSLFFITFVMIMICLTQV